MDLPAAGKTPVATQHASVGADTLRTDVAVPLGPTIEPGFAVRLKMLLAGRLESGLLPALSARLGPALIPFLSYYYNPPLEAGFSGFLRQKLKSKVTPGVTPLLDRQTRSESA